MGHKYAQIAFTAAVKAEQQARGSRDSYARLEGGADNHHRLGEAEADFIAQRDSFYLASVSESGWPYLQHRGGPKGFVRVLDATTLGFADYTGNRQYITTGNLTGNDRVALFFMDYPNRRRLKLLGHMRPVTANQGDLKATLLDQEDGGRVEQAFVIRLAAFDWNCPRHITPRYSEAELEQRLEPLRDEIARLRAKLDRQSRDG